MKPTIAIATGDPAGIGPEVSLKAALDPAVRRLSGRRKAQAPRLEGALKE